MRKILRAAVLSCSVAIVLAAERDAAEVLRQVTAKVLARDAGLPNYTCVETVERDFFKPVGSTLPRSCPVLMELRKNRTIDMKLKWILTDRLRLDVAMTNRGEIHSWVGASKFEDANIDQLVRNGPIGTGSFGGYLALIFHQASSSIRFERNVTQDGRSLMEYSFQMGKERSAYRVKIENSYVSTGYRGTFQADPETSELVRMAMETLDMPDGSDNCNTVTSMEFGLVRIGDGEFLLPKQGRQRFITVTGEEAENRTTFASCREYKGQSTVTFFAEPEEVARPGAKTAAPPPFVLPPGQPFTFELTAPISANTAAAGDPVMGRLVSALRDAKGKTIAPAHAAVEGRLLRMQIIQTKPGSVILVLKLNTVEVKGNKIPLAALRDWGQIPGTSRRIPIQLPFPWEKNGGLFQLPEDRPGLGVGFRSKWLTAVEK